jgi:predicted ATPase
VVELGSLTPESIDSRAAAAEVRSAIDAIIPGHLADGQAIDRQLLLVIDNAEHVLGAVTHTVSRLLNQYPGVHVLITSLRASTAIPIDVWEVASLPVDQPVPTVYPSAAELFRLRVQSSVPTLDLRDRMPSVVELCRRLGGLPLAIEIAAFRMRSVPLSVMLAEEQIMPILDQNGTGGLSHHRSLRESVEWAYGLLDQRQREVLHRLAMLPESMSIDDVLDSTSDEGKLGGRGISVLADLVDLSAVQVKRGRQYVYEIPKLMREHVNNIDN